MLQLQYLTTYPSSWSHQSYSVIYPSITNVFETVFSNIDQESFIFDYFNMDWANLLKLNEKNVAFAVIISLKKQ